MSLRRYLSPDRTDGGGGGSPRGHTGSGERTGAKSDPDQRAPVSGAATSGDAANVGTRLGGEPTRNPAGATGRGNVGDSGADASEGSIDATDMTDVTGDEDRLAAADEPSFGSTSSGGGEPDGRGRGVGSPRGAPGALDPE